jgi:hypothetical protein
MISNFAFKLVKRELLSGKSDTRVLSASLNMDRSWLGPWINEATA